MKEGMEISSKIKEQRIARGLTLHELSILSGVSQSHLTRIEQGTRSASAYVLGKIAKALGLSEIELLKAAGMLAPDSTDDRLERFKRQTRRQIAHMLAELYKEI